MKNRLKTEETESLLAHLRVLLNKTIQEEIKEGKLSSNTKKKLESLGYYKDGNMVFKEEVGMTKYDYNSVVIGQLTDLLS